MSQLFPLVVQVCVTSSPDALTVYIAALLLAVQLTLTQEEFSRFSIRFIGMQGADVDGGMKEVKVEFAEYIHTFEGPTYSKYFRNRGGN